MHFILSTATVIWNSILWNEHGMIPFVVILASLMAQTFVTLLVQNGHFIHVLHYAFLTTEVYRNIYIEEIFIH